MTLKTSKAEQVPLWNTTGPSIQLCIVYNWEKSKESSRREKETIIPENPLLEQCKALI